MTPEEIDGLPELECFDNPYTSAEYVTTIEVPRFTSVCPVFGTADRGLIRLEYVASAKCLEMTSYSHMLLWFSDASVSHEEILNVVFDKVFAAVGPAWLRLTMSTPAYHNKDSHFMLTLVRETGKRCVDL